MGPAEILIALAGVVVGGLMILVILMRRRRPLDTNTNLLIQQMSELRRELQESLGSNRKELQNRLDVIDERIVKNIHESSGVLQKNFAQTSEIIRDVTERLTKLDETNKQVLGFSGQLQSLENILKNPKQRGVLGEYWLETLLGQVLQPSQYEMQFDLGVDEDTGAKLIPDAVLFVKDLTIPIDAKFSLENYNRVSQEFDPTRRDALERDFKNDVKKRIDETAKYVRQDRGTTNFAFMFVPAEGVYYNLISSNVGAVEVNAINLIEYAFKKRVLIVSPTSFFAYLQTVLHGLKLLQIEQSVTIIQQQAEQLMRHLKAYEEQHNKVGRSLETSYRAYSDASKELKKIDKDIYKITDGSTGKQLEPFDIERPLVE